MQKCAIYIFPKWCVSVGWGRSPRAHIFGVTPAHQARQRASVHAGGVVTVRSKENTCSANPKSARRARAQKTWTRALPTGCLG